MAELSALPLNAAARSASLAAVVNCRVVVQPSYARIGYNEPYAQTRQLLLHQPHSGFHIQDR